ncbi:hypothetical protein V6N13_117842 [Hibiscus sabdariffa]|uniref:Uncharacterized protein n=1 Tax=Hibiscus sabdariffa TaxID=183260 RepID=A0ABR2Q9H8_9ROSI
MWKFQKQVQWCLQLSCSEIRRWIQPPGNNNQIFTVLKSNFAPYDREYFGVEPWVADRVFGLDFAVSDTILEANGVLQRISEQVKRHPVDKYEDFLIGIASKFHQGALQVGSSEDGHNWPSSNGMFIVGKKDKFHAHRGTACIEEYNNVAKDFNVNLQRSITELNQELGGIQIVMSNPYDKLLEMIQNPTQFCKACGLNILGLN